MINSDLIIGFVAGNVYGYFFRPIFQFFFEIRYLYLNGLYCLHLWF
jgi:hypothetical protein